MSKYAYCCIATQLINYIKRAQSWLGFNINISVNNLNEIEQEIYEKYTKLEVLKQQIVSNKSLDILTFSELVSNESNIISLGLFYNNKFLNTASNYYTYCSITIPPDPPDDPDNPDPDPTPPPPITITQDTDTPPYPNPNNYSTTFEKRVEMDGTEIESNIVIFGNLEKNKEVIIKEIDKSIYWNSAWLTRYRCGRTEAELKSKAFTAASYSHIVGTTTSDGTILTQLSTIAQWDFVEMHSTFYLQVGNRYKEWFTIAYKDPNFNYK